MRGRILHRYDTICRNLPSTSAPCRFHPESDASETSMFKVIGGMVVYGFALLGLATYLDKLHSQGK